jgi:predicted transcriptional regulator of viral defense system
MKLDTFQLRQRIPTEEFDYTLLTSALSEYAAKDQKINELLKSGVITRVKKGLYVYGPGYNRAPVCKEVLANLIYGPSCISLEYALAYHGLIPERVATITSVTPKRDKAFDTPLGQFNYRYLGADKYPHGIEQVWLDDKHPILIASPEKALCDYVALNKITTIATANDAKNFLESDLRIESSDWKRLNQIALWKLNRVYRNKSIDHILEAL